MGSQSRRVSLVRQGRMTGSKTSAAKVRRKAVVASGPIMGKMVFASDALHWMESMETMSSATEKKGDVVAMFMAYPGCRAVSGRTGGGEKGPFGKGRLLPSPGAPSPHPPKRFDQWGGGAEGVTLNGKTFSQEAGEETAAKTFLRLVSKNE